MLNSPLEQLNLLKSIRLFFIGCCIQFVMKELPLYLNIEWFKFSVFFECIFCIILVAILLNSFACAFACAKRKRLVCNLPCENHPIQLWKNLYKPLCKHPLFNITTVLLAFNGFRHIHSAFRYNGIEGACAKDWLNSFWHLHLFFN